VARLLGASDAARDCAPCCGHPGYPLLYGHGNIVTSWESILSGGHPTGIRPERCRWELDAGGLRARVSLVEQVRPGARVAATNAFACIDGAWRMTAHTTDWGAEPGAPLAGAAHGS